MAPTRTCVGCRLSTDRGDLLRLVRCPGGVLVDVRGSAPGRGAYVHPRTACVRDAARRGALARALRTGLGPEELGRLQTEIEQQMGAS